MKFGENGGECFISVKCGFWLKIHCFVVVGMLSRLWCFKAMEATANESQSSARDVRHCWTFDATMGSQDVSQNLYWSKCPSSGDQRFCCFTPKEFTRLVLDYREYDRFTTSFWLVLAYFYSFVSFFPFSAKECGIITQTYSKFTFNKLKT